MSSSEIMQIEYDVGIFHILWFSFNGVSLNSALMVGPDLYKSLPGVLCKFREGIIAVAAEFENCSIK